MSFKDLEKKTQKVEGKTDVTPAADPKKAVADLPDPVLPSKTTRDTALQGRGDDMYENMPI